MSSWIRDWPVSFIFIIIISFHLQEYLIDRNNFYIVFEIWIYKEEL